MFLNSSASVCLASGTGLFFSLIFTFSNIGRTGKANLWRYRNFFPSLLDSAFEGIGGDRGRANVRVALCGLANEINGSRGARENRHGFVIVPSRFESPAELENLCLNRWG